VDILGVTGNGSQATLYAWPGRGRNGMDVDNGFGPLSAALYPIPVGVEENAWSFLANEVDFQGRTISDTGRKASGDHVVDNDSPRA
jgi:hypothetical protein